MASSASVHPVGTSVSSFSLMITFISSWRPSLLNGIPRVFECTLNWSQEYLGFFCSIAFSSNGFVASIDAPPPSTASIDPFITVISLVSFLRRWLLDMPVDTQSSPTRPILPVSCRCLSNCSVCASCCEIAERLSQSSSSSFVSSSAYFFSIGGSGVFVSDVISTVLSTSVVSLSVLAAAHRSCAGPTSGVAKRSLEGFLRSSTGGGGLGTL